MTQQPTAPACIVRDCNNLSALSSTAEDPFWKLTTYYCADCYEKLLEGDEIDIDCNRMIVERKAPD